VFKDIFVPDRGIVTVTRRTTFLREIIVRPAASILVADSKVLLPLQRMRGKMPQPGDELAQADHRSDGVVEAWDTPEGGALFAARPVRNYAIPDEAHLPISPTVSSQNGGPVDGSPGDPTASPNKDGELIKFEIIS